MTVASRAILKGELDPVLLRITAEAESAYQRFNALTPYDLIGIGA